MTNPIRVLIADDHAIIRKGIRAVLDNVVDIELVGEAANGRDAVAEVERDQKLILDDQGTAAYRRRALGHVTTLSGRALAALTPQAKV